MKISMASVLIKVMPSFGGLNASSLDRSWSPVRFLLWKDNNRLFAHNIQPVWALVPKTSLIVRRYLLPAVSVSANMSTQSSLSVGAETAPHRGSTCTAWLATRLCSSRLVSSRQGKWGARLAELHWCRLVAPVISLWYLLQHGLLVGTIATCLCGTQTWMLLLRGLVSTEQDFAIFVNALDIEIE